MSLQKIRRALSSMCYREVEPGRWLKPVGCHLFTYEEDRNEWTNWFLAYNPGTIERWSSESPSEDGGPFIGQLKDWEMWTNISSGDPQSEFQLSPELYLESTET